MGKTPDLVMWGFIWIATLFWLYIATLLVARAISRVKKQERQNQDGKER